MFSKRLDWTLTRNRIAEYLERRTRPYLDLTGSNPTRAGFTPQAVLDRMDCKAYSPDPRGLLSARRAVAQYQGVTAEQVLLTASTSEAYGFLFKLLADPGDEILAPRPSYPLFDFLARLESVRIVQYPLFYDHGWAIDVEALEALITLRTRAIVLVNPNNPTGSYLKAGELTALETLCARHDLALISDEVFADFALVNGGVRCVATTAKIPAFSLGGLSKACGLPQLKLGWIVSNSLEALDRLELIADTFLSVGTPVQLALPQLLASRAAIQRQIMARLRTNLQTLTELRSRGAGSGLEALIVEGGWTAVLRLPAVKSDEDWVIDLLDQFDVLVQPGFFYDFSDGAPHVVVSLITPDAEFVEGARRVKRAVRASLADPTLES